MINRIHIPQHTPEWLAFREETGYGASEIASVLSEYMPQLTPYIYTPPIQTHLLKIGENVTRFTGNINSEAGHYMEGKIIEMYKYWDNNNPNQMEMYSNMRAGKIQNNIRRCKFIMTNSKYPWLYFSPDAIEYGAGGIKGQLEVKNTTSSETNRYPNKVSPSFLAQVCHGLLISEMDYTRILIYIDGYKLEVITIYKDDPMVKQIQEHIIEFSYKSWRRVLECRKIKLQYGIEYYYQYNVDFMSADQQEGSKILQTMEPEFVGSEKEYDWIRENVYWREEVEIMPGTQEQYELLMRRKPLKDQIKDMEDEIRKIDAALIHSLGGYHQADFDPGYFSYKKDRTGKAKMYVSDKLYQ
jgi:hypothetical protein